MFVFRSVSSSFVLQARVHRDDHAVVPATRRGLVATSLRKRLEAGHMPSPSVVGGTSEEVQGANGPPHAVTEHTPPRSTSQPAEKVYTQGPCGPLARVGSA